MERFILLDYLRLQENQYIILRLMKTRSTRLFLELNFSEMLQFSLGWMLIG